MYVATFTLFGNKNAVVFESAEEFTKWTGESFSFDADEDGLVEDDFGIYRKEPVPEDLELHYLGDHTKCHIEVREEPVTTNVKHVVVVGN